MIGIVQYLQTNHPFSCLEIRFEDGRIIPKVKSNEFRKIVKRFTYGEQSVSKALLVIIRLGQISLVFILSILLNPIFSQVPQCSLNGGGDFNKIMIPNTRVVLPKNSSRTTFLNCLSVAGELTGLKSH